MFFKCTSVKPQKPQLAREPYLPSVSGRNKCMCSSSHALCYGRLQSFAIHNSFASYGGMSFVLIALKRLNVSEPED